MIRYFLVVVRFSEGWPTHLCEQLPIIPQVKSIDIGTRWSATDVLGRMEEMGKYDEIIRISALDENDESFCEEVHTTEYYRELRDETDDSIWCAEYMQEPIEAKEFISTHSDVMKNTYVVKDNDSFFSDNKPAYSKERFF